MTAKPLRKSEITVQLIQRSRSPKADLYMSLVRKLNRFRVEEFQRKLPFSKQASINLHFSSAFHKDEFELSRNTFGIINICVGSCDFERSQNDGAEELANKASGGGIIVVPTHGQTEFYLETLMIDFVGEIIDYLYAMLPFIEKKSSIGAPRFSLKDGTIDSAELERKSKAPSASGGSSELQMVSTETPSSSSFGTGSSSFDVALSTSPALGRRPHRTTSANTSHSSSGSISSSNNNEDITQLNVLNDILREKKRLPGRIHKLLGDVYLLMGCWQKSQNFYMASLEITRGTNDHVFAANALEGQLACLINHRISELEDSQHSIDTSELEKIGEDIIFFYGKSGYYLYLSLFMTDFASFMISNRLAKDASLTHSDKEYFSWLCMRVWNDCGLEKLKCIEDQIMIISRLTGLYQTIGMKRKFGFFLRQLILLMLNLDKNLVKSTDGIFGVSNVLSLIRVAMTDEINDSDSIDSKSKGVYRDKLQRQNFITWIDLKLSILQEALSLAEKSGLVELCIWFHSLQLVILRRQPNQDISTVGLDKILEKIRRYIENVTISTRSNHFTKSTFLKMDQLNRIRSFNIISRIQKFVTIKDIVVSGPKFIKKTKMKEESTKEAASPFIVNSMESAPQTSKLTELKRHYQIVQGEIAQIEVAFENSLPSELKIESLSLVFDGDLDIFEDFVPTQAFEPLTLPVSFKNSQNALLTNSMISFRPQKAGVFNLVGILVDLGNGWIETVPLSCDANSSQLIDDFRASKFKNSEYIKVEVVEAIPLLKILHLEPSLCLYSGQLYDKEIVIKNVSQKAVDVFHIQKSLKFGFSRRTCNSWDEDMEDYENQCVMLSADSIFQIVSEIPSKILPGQQFRIRFRLYGHEALRSAHLKFEYGCRSNDKSSLISREMAVDIEVGILSAISIENVEYLPFEQISMLVDQDGDESLFLLPSSSLLSKNDPRTHICLIDIINHSECRLNLKIYHTTSLKFETKNYDAFDPRKNPTRFPVSPDFYQHILEYPLLPGQRKRVCIPFDSFILDDFFKHLREHSSNKGDFIFPDITTDLLWIPPVPIFKTRQYSHWFNKLPKHILDAGMSIFRHDLDESFMSEWRKEVYKRNWFWYADQFTRQCVGLLEYSGDINGSIALRYTNSVCNS